MTSAQPRENRAWPGPAWDPPPANPRQIGVPRREDSWQRYAPHAFYLIRKELLARADDASRYVYLSDGGHFENLGIYEMVRRRVKYIIACDASTDPEYEFGDLANAVERCSRDFGVEIEIDPSSIRPKQSTKLSPRHFAVGIINYPPKQTGVPSDKGILLYVKSSLTKKEPANILGQRRNKSRFPHDTLVNQFFSEDKFEAYCALGEAMLTEVWSDFYVKRTEIGNEKLHKGDNEAAKGPELAARVTGFFHYLEQQYPPG